VTIKVKSGSEEIIILIHMADNEPEGKIPVNAKVTRKAGGLNILTSQSLRIITNGYVGRR
jgi:hypothetical protein